MADRAPHAETPMTTPAQDTQRAKGARVGKSVYCKTCNRLKKPIGRDQSGQANWCNHWECTGYRESPFPDNLWPGEPPTEQQRGEDLPRHAARCVRTRIAAETPDVPTGSEYGPVEVVR